MKKLKKLTFLIIMLALIVTLSACTDGFDDGTGGGSFDQTIVGTGVNRKVVYSVSMTIEVSDVKKVKTALISLAEEKGGFIERNSEDFYSGNVQQGYLTIKVPTDKLDEFMSSVSGTGKTLYKEVYTTDITDDYVDATAKIAALNEQKTAYQQLLQDATITASDRVEIIKEIAAVDTELYRLMELVNEYDSMIDYSTVSIDIELAPGFFEVAAPIVIGVIFLAGIGVAIYCLFSRKSQATAETASKPQ